MVLIPVMYGEHPQGYHGEEHMCTLVTELIGFCKKSVLSIWLSGLYCNGFSIVEYAKLNQLMI